LESVRITQYFGNTPFAASGAYNGKGHNGIDLAASIGTPVHASLAGVVRGTGNTDATKGCYSFGKWVYIQHANGLGTIYAHLSEIDVSQGQQVSTGQLLGYSGETGYATGPHLHFGVYVDSATKIIKLGEATQSKTPCANVTMPVPTSIQGYLNPLNYLPGQ
jgi:murein DD-endopeptidase MepM/ murein hydrolase activator NlpD